MRSILILLMCAAPALAAEHVSEPACELPVAFDVDVVVAGGSLAGVEAAVAAAKSGAKVLLVESRPYLGSDLCGTQRLWIDKDEKPQTPLTKSLFGRKKVVTPLEVKKALDQALIDGGVPFLTGTFVGELLVRGDGLPAGITIVNRSGRQIVRAKVIVDATKDAALVRRSAAKFTPFTRGVQEFEMIVVGGALAEKAKGRRLPDTVYKSPDKRGRSKDYPVFEYTMGLEMKSDSFRALSKALNKARSIVFGPRSGIVDVSEHLIRYPDNTVVPAASVAGGRGANELPLGAFQPAGIKSLYVLSVYAGLERGEMKKAMRPTSSAVIGRRVGADAANTARRLSAPGVVGYAGSAKGRRDFAVAGTPASFRFRNRPKVKLGRHDLPVLGTFDVVVVGGGTSGAPAGIAAARTGAKTLVIEFLDELGGVGTAGLIGRYWYGHRVGFTAEMDKDLGTQWNVIWKSEWYRSELVSSGAEIWFGSLGCGTLLDGDKVSGVVVATPFGRGVVLADVVIDGTGNADMAASAGAPTEFSISSLGGLSVQMAGYPHRNLGDYYNNTCFAMVDDRDVFDRWHLLLSTRREMEKKVGPYDMGQLIDSRDRRRIVGDYVLTTVDILTRRTFPDTVSHHKSNFDAAAHPDAKMFLVKDMKGPVYTCDMPIRCLTPKGIEGLLAVGLSASSERDAMTLLRMQPDVQNQGYAAGLAAAIAAEKTGGVVRKIDIRQLQKVLVRKGCLEERVLTDRDSFPIRSGELTEAVKTLHGLTIKVHQNRKHDSTLPALAAVMSNPAESIPLLREAYAKSDQENVRTNFARILAVLGDPAGKDTLLKAVEASEGWGRGYGLTSHRETHNSFGEVDRLVMALGFLRTPDAKPLLIKKLGLLTAGSDLSHYKAICLALRLNKDKSLAAPLARLLKKKGVSGHVQPLSYYAASDGALNVPERARTNTSGGSNPLNRKFKELLVAALLFECGDHDGQGRKVLEAYTKDVNGHFASYAHFVLSRNPS